MSTISIWLVAVGFAGMGVAALVSPERIPAMFGGTAQTVDSRNEVRAVYGGFGIAVAGVLIAAPEYMRAGVLLAVAVALFGMAGGRVVGFALDRPSTFYPTVAFAAIESVLGAVLLWAS